MERRLFLKVAGFAAAAFILAPKQPLFATPAPKTAPKQLSLYNLHTGEDLDVCYFSKGRYRSAALEDINYILRDFRTNEIKPVDTDLLDLLNTLARKLDVKAPFNIISGYRSPATNAMLRRLSRNVARNSLHCQGKAIDIRVPGVPLQTVRRVAMSLRSGGVGYYPSADFVHVDTGPVRFW